MKNTIQFYKCDVCGNVVHIVSDSGNALSCCHQQMGLLKENTVDASKEKHVPVVESVDGTLRVSVGAVPHPMTPEHHIEWIAAVQGAKAQIVTLEETGQPEALLSIMPGGFKVYEYCNLHGLWSYTADDDSKNADKHVHSVPL